MSNTDPQTAKVSVVMCTYNGERFLKEQMDSILGQDFPLHEIVVQDDQSTDGTWEILESYKAAHPDLFRLYRNESRVGFNVNFRTAMNRATGDFIALSDQDDIWLPQKIRRQVETIGEADLCYTAYYTDKEFKQPLKEVVSQPPYFEYVFFGDYLGHTMLLRADFVKGINDWDDYIYYDWWLSLRAQLGRGVVKVDEALNWHRHYVGSATTRVWKKDRWEPVAHPTWQPYVYGYFHRLHLQKKGNYQRMYSYLAEHIDKRKYPIPAKIARLMLRRDPFSLLQLCFICSKYHTRIHPKGHKGLKGYFRGFFYPLIFSYGNNFFKLEK